jgi:hypothetical protein
MLGHVKYTEEMKNVCTVLIRKTKRKILVSYSNENNDILDCDTV